MTGVPLVAGEGLVRLYTARGGRRVQALRGVSLAVYPGESVAVVGESGSGKSTLVRLLAALERPDGGRVLWDGADVARLSTTAVRQERRHVQVIFQDSLAAFNPRFRIGQIVGEPLANFPAAGRDEDAAVLALLDRAGLAPELVSRFPHELSGGQQQRVAIARALAPQPRLLLCDEPLSGLDVSVQAQMLQLLQQLRQENGLSLLFVTHNLALVPYVSDRVLVMQAGRVVEELPAQALDTASHPYARALLAAVPDLEDEITQR